MTTPLRKPTAVERIASRKERKQKSDWKGFDIPKASPSRSAAHRKWVIRMYLCEIRGKNGHVCGPKVNASRRVLHVFSHVPTGGRRGVSQKGDDVRGGISLCWDAHELQHNIGWPEFQRRFGIDARAIANAVGDAWEAQEARSKK